jgi:hypothetical protein
MSYKIKVHDVMCSERKNLAFMLQGSGFDRILIRIPYNAFLLYRLNL